MSLNSTKRTRRGRATTPNAPPITNLPQIGPFTDSQFKAIMQDPEQFNKLMVNVFGRLGSCSSEMIKVPPQTNDAPLPLPMVTPIMTEQPVPPRPKSPVVTFASSRLQQQTSSMVYAWSRSYDEVNFHCEYMIFAFEENGTCCMFSRNNFQSTIFKNSNAFIETEHAQVNNDKPTTLAMFRSLPGITELCIDHEVLKFLTFLVPQLECICLTSLKFYGENWKELTNWCMDHGFLERRSLESPQLSSCVASDEDLYSIKFGNSKVAETLVALVYSNQTLVTYMCQNLCKLMGLLRDRFSAILDAIDTRSSNDEMQAEFQNMQRTCSALVTFLHKMRPIEIRQFLKSTSTPLHDDNDNDDGGSSSFQPLRTVVLCHQIAWRYFTIPFGTLCLRAAFDGMPDEVENDVYGAAMCCFELAKSFLFMNQMESFTKFLLRAMHGFYRVKDLVSYASCLPLMAQAYRDYDCQPSMMAKGWRDHLNDLKNMHQEQNEASNEPIDTTNNEDEDEDVSQASYAKELKLLSRSQIQLESSFFTFIPYLRKYPERDGDGIFTRLTRPIELQANDNDDHAPQKQPWNIDPEFTKQLYSDISKSAHELTVHAYALIKVKTFSPSSLNTPCRSTHTLKDQFEHDSITHMVSCFEVMMGGLLRPHDYHNGDMAEKESDPMYWEELDIRIPTMYDEINSRIHAHNRPERMSLATLRLLFLMSQFQFYTYLHKVERQSTSASNEEAGQQKNKKNVPSFNMTRFRKLVTSYDMVDSFLKCGDIIRAFTCTLWLLDVAHHEAVINQTTPSMASQETTTFHDEMEIIVNGACQIIGNEKWAMLFNVCPLLKDRVLYVKMKAWKVQVETIMSVPTHMLDRANITSDQLNKSMYYLMKKMLSVMMDRIEVHGTFLKGEYLNGHRSTWMDQRHPVILFREDFMKYVKSKKPQPPQHTDSIQHQIQMFLAKTTTNMGGTSPTTSVVSAATSSDNCTVAKDLMILDHSCFIKDRLAKNALSTTLETPTPEKSGSGEPQSHVNYEVITKHIRDLRTNNGGGNNADTICANVRLAKIDPVIAGKVTNLINGFLDGTFDDIGPKKSSRAKKTPTNDEEDDDDDDTSDEDIYLVSCVKDPTSTRVNFGRTFVILIVRFIEGYWYMSQLKDKIVQSRHSSIPLAVFGGTGKNRRTVARRARQQMQEMQDVNSTTVTTAATKANKKNNKKQGNAAKQPSVSLHDDLVDESEFEPSYLKEEMACFMDILFDFGICGFKVLEMICLRNGIEKVLDTDGSDIQTKLAIGLALFRPNQ